MKGQQPGPPHRLSPYVELVTAFVEGGLPVQEYLWRYIPMFKQDTARFTKEEAALLDGLYCDADMYDSDPDPDDAFAIDEQELRRCAAKRLEQLQALQFRA